jgi:hypothetical protein
MREEQLHPYLVGRRLKRAVFLTRAQYEARRQHSDVREPSPLELERIRAGQMGIEPSRSNPLARNLLQEPRP